MKFLVISDMHGNSANFDRIDSVFEEVDGVLCAGDFAEFKKPETGLPVLEKLCTKHESIFSVIGNCDEPEFLGEIERQDVSVQKGLVFHEGFAISGSGGGSVFTGTTPNERSEEELQSDFEIVENSTASCADENGRWTNLILISHNPPKDTVCDAVNETVHAGSQTLRGFIEKTEPVLVVTGHIHEGAGIDKIGNTTVINPGPFAEGKYAVVEFEKQEKQWILKDARLLSID